MNRLIGLLLIGILVFGVHHALKPSDTEDRSIHAQFQKILNYDVSKIFGPLQSPMRVEVIQDLHMLKKNFEWIAQTDSQNSESARAAIRICQTLEMAIQKRENALARLEKIEKYQVINHFPKQIKETEQEDLQTNDQSELIDSLLSSSRKIVATPRGSQPQKDQTYTMEATQERHRKYMIEGEHRRWSEDAARLRDKLSKDLLAFEKKLAQEHLTASSEK